MTGSCWARRPGADWRSRDLVTHAVAAYRNGEQVATGSGANVLGDPRIALTWLVNELRTYADGIAAGPVRHDRHLRHPRADRSGRS